MSERRIDALRRRIWRELYRVPVRLAVVREMIDRGDDPGIVLAQEREQRLGAAQ